MLYLILYILLSLISIYTVIKNKESKFINILILMIWIMITISFPIGRDLDSYVYIFNRVSSPIGDALQYHMQRNIGFNVLLYYSKQIYNNYIFFRIVFNVIVVSLCTYTIFKCSNNKLVSTILFFASGTYIIYYGSGIRQMIAMAIFFFTYFNFLLKNKYLLYFISSCVVMLFHEVGVVCFAVLIIYILKDFIYKHIKILLPLSIITSVILFVLCCYIMPEVYEIIQANSVFTHMLIYFSNIEIDKFGILLRIIFILFDLCLFLLSKPNEKEKFMFLTIIFVFFLYISLSGFSISSRIYDFIAIIELIMIPNLIIKIDKLRYRALCLVVLLGMNFILLINDINISCGSNNYSIFSYPYLTVFNIDEINNIIFH